MNINCEIICKFAMIGIPVYICQYKHIGYNFGHTTLVNGLKPLYNSLRSIEATL